MRSARPISSSGWSKLICGSLPFLETFNLTDDFALSLAMCFPTALRSAAVTLRTAFSLLGCFVGRLAICASPSDLASQKRVFQTCPPRNGFEPTPNPVGRLIFIADSAQTAYFAWGCFAKFFSALPEGRPHAWFEGVLGGADRLLRLWMRPCSWIIIVVARENIE